MIEDLLVKAVIATLAAVGIEEYLKNFIKTDKTWIYALLMLPLAVGCYVAEELLPTSVIGSALTVGMVQMGYELLVQGVKKVIKSKTGVTDEDLVSTGEA